MQTVYDTLKHFAFILGDTETELGVEHRGLHRGLKVKGTGENNLPVFEDVPYILQSWVTVDPDTDNSKHGAFSLALPAKVSEDGVISVLNSGGTVDPRFKGITDWELPEGGTNISKGSFGVLVVGTNADEESKIFVPSGEELTADHRGPEATKGSSTVRDLDSAGNTGLKSNLAKALWVVGTPTEVDSDRRPVLAANHFSMGVRNGSIVEHQGGAIVLYNSNIRTSSGTLPKAVAWSAWLDDGPFYEGLGLRDAHLKGVDAEGNPHLPLMFHKERTKFGPGPSNNPSAPLQFEDKFASGVRRNLYKHIGEIVYDKNIDHLNPSGLNTTVPGKWIVEYGIPHSPPNDWVPPDRLPQDPEPPNSPLKGPQIDPDPFSKRNNDPVLKGIDPDPNKGGDDDPVSKAGDDPPTPPMPPDDEDTYEQIIPGGDPDFKGDPVTKSDVLKGIEPGPGESGDGPGTCGHPGSGAPREPGAGDTVGGPGNDNSSSKQDEANKQWSSGNFGGLNFPLDQTNIKGRSLSMPTVNAPNSARTAMRSHLAVSYPVISPLVPGIELEQSNRITLRSNLSNKELKSVRRWGIASSSIFAFGDDSRERQTLTKGAPIVRGGFIIAGSDLFPEEVYGDKESNLDAIFALRKEAKLVFGNPDVEANGLVSDAFVLEREGDKLVFRRRTGGTEIDLDSSIQFKSPIQITGLTTTERNAMTPSVGNIVLDTTEDKFYGRGTSAWKELGGGSGGGDPKEASWIVGEIKPYALPGTLPEGWLDCDGSQCPDNELREKLEVAGSPYGTGAEDFPLLPNLTERALEGVGTEEGNLGNEFGSPTMTLTNSHLPSHTHTINHGHNATVNAISTSSEEGHTHENDDTHVANSPVEAGGTNTIAVDVSSHNGESGSVGNGEAFGLRGPRLGVRFIIYGGESNE
jgi:microcystin-dependent protein